MSPGRNRLSQLSPQILPLEGKSRAGGCEGSAKGRFALGLGEAMAGVREEPSLQRSSWLIWTRCSPAWNEALEGGRGSGGVRWNKSTLFLGFTQLL